MVTAVSWSCWPRRSSPPTVVRCGKVLNCLARAQRAPPELPFPDVGVAGDVVYSGRAIPCL
eukprot:7970523-Pyramimonas_sp.AAC.1